MTADASTAIRVLIGTTDGPVEILSLYGEAPAVRRSVVCIGGTIRRAGIERGYNDFVARKTGVIQRAFGPGCFRIDVSGRIDAGASWQLAFSPPTLWQRRTV